MASYPWPWVRPSNMESLSTNKIQYNNMHKVAWFYLVNKMISLPCALAEFCVIHSNITQRIIYKFHLFIIKII